MIFGAIIFIVCIVLVALSCLLLGAQLIYDADAGMGGWKPPETGIVILEGLPGSGKSYRAVRWLYDAVRFERRIIYTNLPVKFRVMRALLRKTGGAHLTRYVVDLSQDHFFRAVARFAELTRFVESQKRFMDQKAAEARWLAENGPHIPWPMNASEWVQYRQGDGVSADEARAEFVALASDDELGCGPDGRLQANWMQYGSAVAIDEMHKWCDQRKQKDEDPRILDFLTMHRHGLFFVLLLTQNAMQISISFRRNCVKYWRCADMRNLAVFFGFKIPLPLFRYEEIAASDLASDSERTAAKPQSVKTEAPFLDGGLIWRLYSSFTHAGSARKLRRVIERNRMVAEGEHYDPNRTRERAVRIQHRKQWALRVCWAVVALAFVGVAFAVGQSRAGAEPLHPAGSVAAAVAGPRPSANAPTTEPAPAPVPAWERPGPRGRPSVNTSASGAAERDASAPPVLSAIGGDFGIVGGQLVRVGQVFNGSVCVRVVASGGYADFVGPTGPWRWYVGDRLPFVAWANGGGVLDPATTAPASQPAGRVSGALDVAAFQRGPAGGDSGRSVDPQR